MTSKSLELISFVNILGYGSKLITNTEELKHTNIPRRGQRYRYKLNYCHFLPFQDRHSLAIETHTEAVSISSNKVGYFSHGTTTPTL